MELLNNTGMVTGYTMGMDVAGRESLVVVVKGTFNIPKNPNKAPQLLEEQVPLVEADTFTGEPGFSSPLFEVDYALIKQRCDVTLVGSAYAPGGKATRSVQAGFMVGNLSKALNVFGNRYWVCGATGPTISIPERFEKRSISYDTAYGGVDQFHQDESKHDAYLANPVGVGYHNQLADELVHGTPAPSTEECSTPVKRPDGKYSPMSFGPVGRGWQPRIKFGGTYDQRWFEETFPFLPADFNELYYQSAPRDQQMPYLQGGERVALLNLTEDGKRIFEIPKIDVPVVFFKRNSDKEEQQAVLDTFVLEPDEERFTLTWRASVRLKNNVFEVPEALVGNASRTWWRARALGKTYYPSISAMIREENSEGDDD